MTSEFDWCVREEMKGEWRNGIAVDHNYLRETSKAKNCIRCGKDIRNAYSKADEAQKRITADDSGWRSF